MRVLHPDRQGSQGHIVYTCCASASLGAAPSIFAARRQASAQPWELSSGGSFHGTGRFFMSGGNCSRSNTTNFALSGSRPVDTGKNLSRLWPKGFSRHRRPLVLGQSSSSCIPFQEVAASVSPGSPFFYLYLLRVGKPPRSECYICRASASLRAAPAPSTHSPQNIYPSVTGILSTVSSVRAITLAG